MEPTPRKTTGDLRPAGCGESDLRYYLRAGRAVEDPAPAVWAGVLAYFQGSSRGR
jgi:hypothetical protein